MKIKALHSIRHDGKRLKAGQVADLNDVVAASLIAQGWAEEASASAKEDVPEEVKRDTNKMVESTVAEGTRRGRR